MKILKPGKVEQRKFVCKKCECVFVAKPSDIFMHPFDDDERWAECPECSFHHKWDDGEPYEEPTRDKKYDTEHLAEILLKTYELQRPVTTQQVAELLIANGVTFREG